MGVAGVLARLESKGLERRARRRSRGTDKGLIGKGSQMIRAASGWSVRNSRRAERGIP